MTAPAANNPVRILFVDDDQLVLQGLQRMLRPMRPQWEMSFVDNGGEALRLMDQQRFQVVVSDMRMPGMNGAEFLTEVMQRSPETVRIILSGHADRNLIMKCVGAAHQFLAKPCEPESIKAAIARGCAFTRAIQSEKLRRLIARMDQLPSMPAVLSQIVEKLQNDQTTVEEIAALISNDIGISAKLLKLVNSAFFGLHRQVSSTEEAVSYLGLETIRALVLVAHAFSGFSGKLAGPVSLETLWAHSLQVAARAREIARQEGMDRRAAEECFIGGLLHDVGKLALSVNLPEEYAAVLKRVEIENLPLPAAEFEAFGADHGDVGGYILSLWGLPARVVEAITFHHAPHRVKPACLTPLVVVHVANALDRADERRAGDFHENLDLDLLAELGLAGRLEHWRNIQL